VRLLCPRLRDRSAEANYDAPMVLRPLPWLAAAWLACPWTGTGDTAPAGRTRPAQASVQETAQQPTQAPTPRPTFTDPSQWVPREDLQAKLPKAITVREFRDDALPLRGWLVTARPEKSWRPEASQPETGLRTTSAQATALGAVVAVNAGFFAPSGSVSTVVDEGEVICCGPSAVNRDGSPYPVTRAAIGFDREGRPDCAWTWCFDRVVYALEAPVANAPGKPAQAPTRDQGRPWKGVEELLGAGPMLVADGALHNTEVAECFQSLGGTSRHPRTAAGWAEDGTLLLLVLDGRSKASRGATLNETAAILLAHGAHEALNLDGGGSTTLWVAGQVLNQPSDRAGERPVASILALVPEPDPGG
jgi:exopolysaccharide biosynthesis protein